VDEEVAERAALLAVAPAVDVPGDGIVETQPTLLPELEHGHRRRRLARGVEEHQVVGLQGPAGKALADGRVEQRLAPEGDVELRAFVPSGRSLAEEEVGKPREAGCGGRRHHRRRLDRLITCPGRLDVYPERTLCSR